MRDGPSAQGREIRLRVDAESQRALARRRRRGAWGALPLFVGLGVGALVVSLKFTLVAVICGFMAYACVAVARAATGEIAGARDREYAVIDGALAGVGAVREVVLRGDHVRLLIDGGAGPTSVDLPLTMQQCDALAGAGVRVVREGGVRRVLGIVGGVAAALIGLVAVKVALGMIAVLVLADVGLVIGVVAAVGLLRWAMRR